jgi:tRNA(Arg) A34 adenosine deaminase TadA
MNAYRRERLIEISRSLQHCREGRSLHFSYILKNNQLLVSSVNSYTKLHPYHKFGTYKPLKDGGTKYVAGVHSETAAIREYINRFGNSDFSGLTLFNVRLSKSGEPMMAKPCGNCQNLLDSFNFKSIVWT